MPKRAEFLKQNDAIVAETIGKRLNTLRNNRGLTLDDVGSSVSVSHQEVSAYERGVRKPSLSILIALATYFGTSVDYLLGLEPWENGLENVDPRSRMTDYIKAV